MKLLSYNFQNIKISSTGKQAVEYAKEFKPDVILMDIMLKDKINGIEAAHQIHAHRNIPIIYITGNIHLKDDKKLLATKPVAVLDKPFKDCELLNYIDKALKLVNGRINSKLNR